MITLEWNDREGMALPDGMVVSWVDQIVHTWNSLGQTPMSLSIGTESIFNEFRVRVKRGEIPHYKIKLTYNGQDVAIDKHGRLDWPAGFCNLIQDQLCELLAWKSDDRTK